MSRPFLLMPFNNWPINRRLLYSRVTKLSIHWNCPGKWCQRLSSNRNCLDNRSWILSTSWICSDNWLERHIWNAVNNWYPGIWYCLIIGIVPTNILEVLFQFKLTWQLISDTAHLMELSEQVMLGALNSLNCPENDLGDCELIGVVLTNDFRGCLLNGIVWAIGFGWFTRYQV